MDSKFLSTLGLARRAGKLVYGYDAVIDALHSAHLILFASDLSARSRNSVLQQAAAKNIISITVPFTMEQLAAALGTKPVGIVGIIEKGFAGLLTASLAKENAGGTPL